MAKLSKFGAAFKAARAAGKKEFSFGGKKYNTKVKGEGDAPKSAPTPTSRQGQDKGSGGRATSGPAKSGASRSTDNKVKKAKPQQGPSAPRAVGMAKAGSGISKAMAKRENAPQEREKQGPVAPRQVGIARKGSTISRAVARRENAPRKKS